MSQPGSFDPHGPWPTPRPDAQPGSAQVPGAAGDWPANQRPDQPPERRRDAEAALESYVEMGPQWQSEVVDSFLTRVDATMKQQWQEGEYLRQQKLLRERAAQKNRTRDLVLALVFAIPLTGIASSAGLLGMVVCWAGIAAVLFALNPPRRGGGSPHQSGR